MEKRAFKNKVYTELARMVKAMANPHRLEIIDLLGQSARTVEEIAMQTDMSVANASQHLQVLKTSCLVQIKREGNFIRYSLANPKVYKTWYTIRETGFDRLAETQKLIKDFRKKKNTMETIHIKELLQKISSGKMVLLDVRPRQEYDTGHIPGALSVPVEQLAKQMTRFSKQKEYIAYCRGPLCVFADDAVYLLTRKGFTATRLEEGFPDWKLKGLPVEAAA